jgi:hypothetical protein
MTDGGRAILAGYMSAQTPAEMRVVTEMAENFNLMSEPGEGPSPADDYALKMFMAKQARPKIAAVLLDEAAQVALTAGAYEEALLALEEAQQCHPNKMRRANIESLKQVLATLTGKKHELKVSPVVQEERHKVIVAEVVGARR